jgi:hypothetical protein
MRKEILTTIGITGLALTLTAAAADAGQVADREARQRARIHQGVATGQLTPHETTVLRQEQHRIDNMRQRALADGHVGPKELVRLDQAQDHANRDIYRLQHNERQVPPAH